LNSHCKQIGLMLASAALLALAWPASANTSTNSNTGAVSNGGKPPEFLVAGTEHVDSLSTYHWNGARGAAPGTISIRTLGGQTIGTWAAQGSSGQGGAPNVNWTVHPNINLTTGTYEVVDSSPATWSQNSASHGFGFFTLDYTMVLKTVAPPPPPPTQPPVLTHTPCHANSSSFVELAKPTCSGPPGTMLTLYVSRSGMKTPPSPLWVQFRSGTGYNAISVMLGGPMNTPGLSSNLTAPLKLETGTGLAPNSTYSFAIPAGACFSGHGHIWWFDLWIPGSGDVDAVPVRC
jgi:hypothetical protein